MSLPIAERSRLSRSASGSSQVSSAPASRSSAALVPPQNKLGEHLRRDGQRLDHLANFYLGDPNGFWRIAEINGAILPDTLALVRSTTIPTQR